ncbi:DegQ family serine endoprotease [Novispirillum sp. DQ9]|uniref:DegQ family serine endoprotease n=1 Tax=Novispirillum sp. DQ9 TaxID=3398612 RepID=UPI003C79DB76
MRWRGWVLGVILAAAGLAGTVSQPAMAQQAGDVRVPRSQAEVRLSFAPIVKAAAPAVVNIYTSRVVEARRRVSPLFNDPFFRRFFQIPDMPQVQRQVQNALGSGVIVKADGIVVTNHHVIEGADEIRVVLNDRREFAAEVLGADEKTDLAILRLIDPPADLSVLPFGKADALEVGDLVLAIGNPFGVGQTVTSGIVSALARTTIGVADFRSFIQTDAAVNPGNSGGALVTMDGALVGINTAIYSRDGGSNGIGFAIPSEMVQAVLAGILDGGKVVRSWLGANGQPVGPDIAQSLGLDRPGGVLVNHVSADSPAARGGLELGDVVVAIDGRDVVDVQGLRYRIATLPVGGTATLTVIRDGAVRDLAIALEPAPDRPDRQETELSGRHPLAGTRIANLNPALAEERGAVYQPDSVIVTAVARDGYAARMGVQPGDIVRAINGQPVRRVADVPPLLRGQHPGWVIAVQRGERVLNFRVGA